VLKTYAKSFAVFLTMLVVTRAIVVPQAVKLNIPFIKDL
jgi:hypothetical protein